MPHISQLFIYPVKSLGGISVQQAQVTSRGLLHDRRWMLIDDKNQFLSQRKYPQLALFEPQLLNKCLKITHLPTGLSLSIPYQPLNKTQVIVNIWDSICSGTYVSNEADSWFTKILGTPCRLIYMTDESIRQVDQRYAQPGHITSFADGYPMLLIGEESLNDLNDRLNTAVSISRFRPNIVVSGTNAYQEDHIKHFKAGGINFYGVKLCARCVMIGVDPQTGITGTEPLKTLANYRKANNKIYFGQNLVHQGEGVISVGGIIDIIN